MVIMGKFPNNPTSEERWENIVLRIKASPDAFIKESEINPDFQDYESDLEDGLYGVFFDQEVLRQYQNRDENGVHPPYGKVDYQCVSFLWVAKGRAENAVYNPIIGPQTKELRKITTCLSARPVILLDKITKKHNVPTPEEIELANNVKEEDIRPIGHWTEKESLLRDLHFVQVPSDFNTIDCAKRMLHAFHTNKMEGMKCRYAARTCGKYHYIVVFGEKKAAQRVSRHISERLSPVF